MHKTYKGKAVDMDSIVRQHEETTALGNMRVNARGDKLGKNGEVVEKAGDVNRKHYTSSKSTVSKNQSLKGDLPKDESKSTEPKKSTKKKVEASKKVETELENGDIVVDDKSED